MATLEFFNLVMAEAGDAGDVWLHGGQGEAGLHVRFPAGESGLAPRIVAAINAARRRGDQLSGDQISGDQISGDQVSSRDGSPAIATEAAA
jgi:hypothetical protein